MGSTKINVGAVIGLSSQIQKANSIVSGVRIDLYSTRNHIDGRILNRNNLSNRLQSVISQFSSIETRISRIKGTVERGANSYFSTDSNVKSWSSALLGRIASAGFVSQGVGVGLGASILSKQSASKTVVDEKDNGDSTFVKILKDDWKLEGAIIGGTKSGSGDFLGFSTSGTAEGELIGGSIKTKSKAKWDIQKGDAGIEKSVEAEGHLAKGKLKGNIGLLGGEIGGSVGNVGATGKVGASLFKDGKLSPAVEAKLKAEASVAKGDASLSIGNDEFDAHGKASGTLLGAEAEVGGSAGVITYKDSGGTTKTELGVKGKVGAEAYVAQGKLSGGFKIFGIKIDIGVEGKAGGAGVSAEGRVTTGGVSGKIGAGLGLGAGLELSIDWSNFSLW